MAVIDAALLLKSERKKRGITQQELAHDICTQTTLSHIESGLYSSQKGVIEKLLNQLCFDNYYFSSIDNTVDAEITRLKNEILNSILKKNVFDVMELLIKLKSFDVIWDSLDIQFFETIDIFLNLYNKKYINLNKQIYKILSYTILNPTENISLDFLLTKTEILLFFLLSEFYKKMNDYDNALNILSNLNHNFSKNYQSYELYQYFYPELYLSLAQIYILLDDYKQAYEFIQMFDQHCLLHYLNHKILNAAYEKIICEYKVNEIENAKKTFYSYYFSLKALNKDDDAEVLFKRIHDKLNLKFEINFVNEG